MKTLALLIAVVVVALIFVNPNALPGRIASSLPTVGKASASTDPIQAMKELRSYFPNQCHVGGGILAGLYDIGYDVRKTDSLVNPMVGMLNFSHAGLDFQFVFHWKQNHWVFIRMLNRENGDDFTHVPGGLEIINSPEMVPFMARCR